ncbi:MFS transporter [Pyrobaculum calidifontis]|uniref:Major facilitator superfamily MFS_1 n=1 Tax=Pyrobaculum calidifontis (strain DSM 21063 / JCM 11548 / VA1) TaxID=410359 RepID=A3MWS1_PYRCJ|nr:MFS transporter [Pyrobaculum calidifontis]ABO09088.1 major facilitator superfamily MFS_1 [Pyrobaculum calidifontis JCM 11548]
MTSAFKLIVFSGLGWMFDAMDVLILSYLLVAASKDLGLDTQARAIVVLANNLGMLIGAILFGRLSDRVGRRPVFMTTLLIYSVATALSAFSRTWPDLAILRLIAGLGLGGELPVVAAYVSESSAPKERGRNVVLLESFWSLGAIAAAAVSLFLFTSIGWRASLLLLGLTAFYVFVIRRTLPESPAWATKAEARLTAELIRRAAVVSAVWFALAFGYYGAFLWLPTILATERGFTEVRTYQFMFYTTLAQLPGYFSAAYLVEKIGRRPTAAAYFLVSALAALLFANSVSSTELFLWALALNFFNLGVWGVIYAYTPELFPTAVRGAAMGIAGSAARVGMIIGPTLYPLIGINAMAVIASLWALAAALVYLLPETRHVQAGDL